MPKNTKLCGQPMFCQVVSLLPKEIFNSAIDEHKSDYYYKSMSTFKQFVFILYGVITKLDTLNGLCRNILFLEDKLSYIGINELPATSTLSYANINRNSDVFRTIYFKLCAYFKDSLFVSAGSSLFEDDLKDKDVFIIDSTTISIFADLVKGAGRTPLSGQKKGGFKVHSRLPLGSQVPDLVHITESAMNDKDFLGQLKPLSGAIYIFDKGYVNYSKWKDWSNDGVFFVSRLNENANFEILEGTIFNYIDYADGGIISDQSILLSPSKTALKARLIVFKDPESGKVLKFVSNMFDYEASTIIQLYKYRWSIEVFFKRLKQNFQLDYFYSDSSEGIKTQIWIALIANLMLTVLHVKTKETEVYKTMVSMIANNMTSYFSIYKMLETKRLTVEDRNIKIIQLDLFEIRKGGVLEETAKSP
jgi:Transposase DDE domain/Domain of unknown function (DUF4372)